MLLQSKANGALALKMIEEFSAATGLASIVVNIHGAEISEPCNFTSFCQKIRENATYRSLCQQCTSFGGLEAAKLNQACIYRCHAGLIDISVPIIVSEQLIGFIIGGQVLCEEKETFPFIHHKESDCATRFAISA